MALSAPADEFASPPYVELAREHLPDLLTAAQWLTDDPREALELTQASLRDGSWRFRESDGDVDLRNWLLGILCDLCEAHTGWGRQSPRSAAEAEPLAALVRALPNHLRQPLVLCDITGLSYRDIATALRVPVGAVRSRIWRGREALLEALGSEPRV